MTLLRSSVPCPRNVVWWVRSFFYCVRCVLYLNVDRFVAWLQWHRLKWNCEVLRTKIRIQIGNLFHWNFRFFSFSLRCWCNSFFLNHRGFLFQVQIVWREFPVFSSLSLLWRAPPPYEIICFWNQQLLYYLYYFLIPKLGDFVSILHEENHNHSATPHLWIWTDKQEWSIDICFF